jgi:prepilin-type N-terminal cleavage/methylation domain-containing protein
MAKGRNEMEKTRADSGFTLLEVLVALVILAAGSALTLSLISGSLRNIRKVQLRTRAIEHAETVMELSLLDDTIRRPTTLQGDFADGTRWLVKIDEFQLPDLQPPALQLQQQLQQQQQLPMKLFAYRVEVFGPESKGADFELETLKLVNVVEPGKPVQVPE